MTQPGTLEEQTATLEAGGVEVGEGVTVNSLGVAFGGKRWEK